MLTRNEIFKKVVNHLTSQGCRSTDENGICRMVGMDNNRDPAGVLIDLNFYDDTIENRTCDSEPVRSILIRCGVNSEDISMVRAFQRCHDKLDPEEWPQQFEKIAQRFRVKYEQRVS